MIAVGIPIAIYNIFIYGTSFLIRFIFSLLFTFALSYLFFRLNLFGGADAKCLIAISVLIPLQPGFTFLSYHFPINFNSSLIIEPLSLPFAITTLFNAAIVSLIVPPSTFFYNFLNLSRGEIRENLSYAFIGYKLRIDALTDAKQKHIRLLHSYEEEEEWGQSGLKRKIVLGGVEIDTKVVERLKNYHAQGKLGEEVWVTSELPFMLFITAGFFSSIFYGNLILNILYFVFVFVFVIL